MSQKKKIAFIHRYGLEGWVCCGGHVVPGIIQSLEKSAEIHFFGPKSTEKPNQPLRNKVILHQLPYCFNRANPTDKITKTLHWYFWLPIIGIRCRMMGVKIVWNDETVPFTAFILRIFYGKNVAITVMDFFARIYFSERKGLKWVCRLIEAIDFASWKKLPVIFTKVLYTQEVLAEKGIPKEVMHLYRNPVDYTKFYPVSDETRMETRKKLGFSDNDMVLSHHGILHPNKGNDWVLQRIAELKDELPNLKYLLIGNGPEMDKLKNLAEELEITDRVTFTGWLPTETDLNNALASSDIGLVMRTGQETDHFHMTDTLAHEIACAKPILAVNLRGIAEVITDGENGFIFNHKDPNIFNQKLVNLVQSPQQCLQFSEASIATSKKISSVDNIIKKITTTLLKANV